MKRSIGLGLAIYFLVAGVGGHAAENRIGVSGTAHILVPPDQATFVFGIETWDRTVAKAKKDNDAVLKKMLSICDTFAIDRNNVQVDQISVEVERKGWNEKPVNAVEGYFVRRRISVVLSNLARFDDFLSGVLETGVNYLHGVDLQTTELKKHRDRARMLAIKAAREKAGELAKAIGQKAGRANSIQEVNDSWVSYYNSWWTGRSTSTNQNVVQESGTTGSGNSSESSAPGQITVRVTVNAEFQLD